MPGQKSSPKKEDTQRRRGRLAWMIGAPLGGLGLGLFIAGTSLQVAEDSYRTSVSNSAAIRVLDSPAVIETTTVEKTVTVHPAPEPPNPEPTTGPAPTPASTEGKPDYGAPVRDYCKDRFPGAADLKAYNLCVTQTSGGTVKP